MTGAKVFLKIISPSGKLFGYNSKTVTYNATETQTDNIDGLSPLTFSPTESRPVSLKNQTPQKKKRIAVEDINVEGLPGKSKRLEKQSGSSTRTTGKCQECGIIFESKKDVAFRKSKGRRITEWIGCDRPRCKYWAHASCAGLHFTPNKPISDHAFLCDQHRKR